MGAGEIWRPLGAGKTCARTFWESLLTDENTIKILLTLFALIGLFALSDGPRPPPWVGFLVSFWELRERKV